MIRIETAGFESRRVRIANLPREVSGVLRTVLARYGVVKEVQEETWFNGR